MKIAFFELKDEEKEYLEDKFPNDDLIFSSEVLSDEDFKANPDIEVISTHTDSKITADVINKLPQLKLIATRTTGFDHIDLKTASGKGVIVCNVPTYGENTVAEYAFALLLAVSRKIVPAYNRIHTEKRFNTDGLQGFDLMGKTIGVIGTGHIGEHVIKIARGFDMQILAFDAFPKNELQSTLGFKYMPLDELLQKSDIVTLHVPLIPQTKHLINKENIKKFKNGSILINTARGAVVETAAILEGLESGVLSGVGIDVFEEETEIRERELSPDSTLSRLINIENVIVTPHNAFNSKEAEERIIQTTVDNIQSYIEGNPQNLVKPL